MKGQRGETPVREGHGVSRTSVSGARGEGEAWMEERTAGEGEHSRLGSWGPRRNDLSSTDKESAERGWVKVSYM